MQILEYIIDHYALFLGGAILILLAIIGYYADKNNFGLGQIIEKNNDDNKKDNNNIESEERVEDLQETEQTSNELSLSENYDDSSLENFDIPDTFKDDDSKLNGVDDSSVDLSESNMDSQKELNLDNSLLDEESFNKFNEEFNSLLPEKEFISDDLLSDIEDLELDKTQKFDLTDLSDLDDIELPKIKNLSHEEQDIWKF